MSLPGLQMGSCWLKFWRQSSLQKEKFHVPLASGSPDICIEIGAKAPSQDANIEIWGRLHRHEMDKQDSLGDSFQTTRTPNRNTIHKSSGNFCMESLVMKHLPLPYIANCPNQGFSEAPASMVATSMLQHAPQVPNLANNSFLVSTVSIFQNDTCLATYTK